MVKHIIGRKQQINIGLFLESVEDFANRIGLLFCDDPCIIERMLNEEGTTISGRGAKERLGSLLVWALSEDYASLRKQIGINIQ